MTSEALEQVTRARLSWTYEFVVHEIALDVHVNLLGSDSVRVRRRLGILGVLEDRDWLELERTGAERHEVVDVGNCEGSQSGDTGK